MHREPARIAPTKNSAYAPSGDSILSFNTLGCRLKERNGYQTAPSSFEVPAELGYSLPITSKTLSIVAFGCVDEDRQTHLGLH